MSGSSESLLGIFLARLVARDGVCATASSLSDASAVVKHMYVFMVFEKKCKRHLRSPSWDRIMLRMRSRDLILRPHPILPNHVHGCQVQSSSIYRCVCARTQRKPNHKHTHTQADGHAACYTHRAWEEVRHSPPSNAEFAWVFDYRSAGDVLK